MFLFLSPHIAVCKKALFLMTLSASRWRISPANVIPDDLVTIRYCILSFIHHLICVPHYGGILFPALLDGQHRQPMSCVHRGTLPHKTCYHGQHRTHTNCPNNTCKCLLHMYHCTIITMGKGTQAAGNLTVIIRSQAIETSVVKQADQVHRETVIIKEFYHIREKTL